MTRLLILERRRRCTPAGSRALTCREQAVTVLRRFRDRTRVEQLGRDHGISRATAYRYVDEGTEALERAREEGTPFVIPDGKLFSTDRLAEQVTSVKGEAIDAWYSGNHHRPGGNVQAVIRPDGLPLRASQAEPGHVHDITASRVHALPALYRAAALAMPTLADSGYEGAGIGIHVPVKSPAGSQELAPDNQARNSLLRGLRFQGNAGSPCSPSAGPSSSTPPPAPASSPRSSAPPSSSPIRAQIHQGKITEITSLLVIRQF